MVVQPWSSPALGVKRLGRVFLEHNRAPTKVKNFSFLFRSGVREGANHVAGLRTTFVYYLRRGSETKRIAATSGCRRASPPHPRQSKRRPEHRMTSAFNRRRKSTRAGNLLELAAK